MVTAFTILAMFLSFCHYVSSWWSSITWLQSPNFVRWCWYRLLQLGELSKCQLLKLQPSLYQNCLESRWHHQMTKFNKNLHQFTKEWNWRQYDPLPPQISSSCVQSGHRPPSAGQGSSPARSVYISFNLGIMLFTKFQLSSTSAPPEY